ncbi:MAG: hypothetical protein R3C25_08680 [Hyphomonadaceae bacterium]
MTLARKYGWGLLALAWGAAEATIFFIVPDVLLSLAGLCRGGREASNIAFVAAIGAALGGCVMFAWSATDHAAAVAAVSAVPAVSDAMMNAAAAGVGERGWLVAALLGPLTSTPYKVFALLAPEAGVSPPLFVLTSVLARLPRFLLAAWAGGLARQWFDIGGTRLVLVWAMAWIVFYAAFFSLMPN